jgi:hypothetical protein
MRRSARCTRTYTSVVHDPALGMKLEDDHRLDASCRRKLELIDGHDVGEIELKVGPVQGSSPARRSRAARVADDSHDARGRKLRRRFDRLGGAGEQSGEHQEADDRRERGDHEHRQRAYDRGRLVEQ